MFVAVGDVGPEGGSAAAGSPAPHLTGARLLHVEARLLIGQGRGGLSRTAVDIARRAAALISVDLGDEAWIRERGGSRIAYALAAIHADVLFAEAAPAAELGAPLEGIASIPVVKSRGGCSVFGRFVAGPDGAGAASGAVEAAFCIALLAGETPVEAAGRAVLVEAAAAR